MAATPPDTAPDFQPLVSLLTPRGRGAVATVAFQGDVRSVDAAGVFRAANGRPLADQTVGRVLFGHWGRDPSEEVVVCRTSDLRLEVHCHGGEAASARVLSHFEQAGAGRVSWHDFVERTEGPFAADVAEALSAATTARTAAFIARQADGPLRSVFDRIATGDPIRDRTELLVRLDRLLRWADFGMHLTRPWRVVLYGRPNVGKSSLINALVGFERAIVFDRPGTTRDVVTAETAFDGWPVRLSDTAGLRQGADDLESAGIERAKTALAEADLRVHVVDRSRPSAESGLFDEKPGLRPRLIALNKSDLPGMWGEDPLPEPAVAVSAKTGDGVRELIARVTNLLVPETPADDEAVPVSERQVERIRRAREALVRDDLDEFRRAAGEISP